MSKTLCIIQDYMFYYSVNSFSHLLGSQVSYLNVCDNGLEFSKKNIPITLNILKKHLRGKVIKLENIFREFRKPLSNFFFSLLGEFI